MTQSTHWCFTLNNYTDAHLQSLDDLQSTFKYIVYGREVGESGTPHLQGYVITRKNQRLAAMTKLIPGAHFEIKRGTPQQASDYCKKDGNFTEYGELPKSKAAQGQMEKDRWAEARSLAKAGKFEDIDDELYIRYRSTLHKIHEDNPVRPAMLSELTHEWWYGPKGCSKSYTAELEYPDRYDKNTNKWWDGYNGQSVVIIEEFDIRHEALITHLKKWCDRFAFSAEVKGGTMVIRPAKIIVISNYHPSRIWTQPDDIEPILRKFKLRHFDTPYKPDTDLIPPSPKRAKL